MGQDRCDLAAGESDTLARELIDCPGSGIKGVVESKVTTQAPVPAAQDTWTLQRQDLLIHSPPIPTQAYCKLDQESRQARTSHRKHFFPFQTVTTDQPKVVSQLSEPPPQLTASPSSWLLGLLCLHAWSQYLHQAYTISASYVAEIKMCQSLLSTFQQLLRHSG